MAAPPPPPPRRVTSRSGGRFPYVIAVIALIVIGASAAVLVYFSGAKIEITPTTASVPVDSSFTAGPSGDVPFTLVTAKKSATVSIPSTGTKQADTPASGQITIYNAQSKTQTLVANTRFATAAGLIFRIRKGVTIPAGSSANPGTATATVYADQPGALYDIAPASFTVPGLAGTPEASAVYARSTSAMAGGSSGVVPVVDPTAEQQAVASLESSMGTDLASTLAAPAGYVLLPGAATTTYQELPPAAGSAAGQASIVVEAVATGVAFPQTGLASAIAATGSGPGVTLGDGSNLTLTPSSGFPTGEGDSFSFSLSGTAILVSTVDSSTIATAVAGKSKSEAQVALANYPAVKKAVLVLRPFWRTRFPEDPSAITVTTEAPEAP